MNIDWAEVFAQFVVLVVYGRIVIWLYHLNNKRREKKFLKVLKIVNHERDTVITLSSVESTDREALDKIKEQLDETA